MKRSQKAVRSDHVKDAFDDEANLVAHEDPSWARDLAGPGMWARQATAAIPLGSRRTRGAVFRSGRLGGVSKRNGTSCALT